MDQVVYRKLGAHLQEPLQAGASAAGALEKDGEGRMKRDLRWLAVRLFWALYGIVCTIVLQNLINTAR